MLTGPKPETVVASINRYVRATVDLDNDDRTEKELQTVMSLPTNDRASLRKQFFACYNAISVMLGQSGSGTERLYQLVATLYSRIREPIATTEPAMTGRLENAWETLQSKRAREARLLASP